MDLVIDELLDAVNICTQEVSILVAIWLQDETFNKFCIFQIIVTDLSIAS